MSDQSNMFEQPAGAEVFNGSETGGQQLPAVSKSTAITEPLSPEDMEFVKQRAQKFFELQDALKTLAIKVTKEHQWTSFGEKGKEKPYPDNAACKSIAAAFGMSLQQMGPPMITPFEDDKGKYAVADVSVRASLGDRFAYETGSCSTRDKLFGRKGGKLRDISEVDIINVRLKALTSGYRRAIKALIGFDPTWEDLKSAGLDVAKIRSERAVTYAKGKEGGRTDTPDVRKRKGDLFVMMIALCDNDEDRAKDWLKELTTYTPKTGDRKGQLVEGTTDVFKIGPGQLEWIEKKIKKEYEEKVAKGA